MLQQQCLHAAAPRKKMASPWWDFFSHCKEMAESDSEDEDDDRHENNNDTSYADNKNDGCVPNSADDDDLTTKSDPHSPASIARTPLKLISTQSNDYSDDDNDDEAARPDTPVTHHSSFENSSSSSSSSSLHDDECSEASSSLQSIELNQEEECNFIDEVTPGSLVSSSQASSSLKLVSSVVDVSPPSDDAKHYNIKQQQQLQMQSISEEEEDCEEHDDKNDTTSITNSNSDDDYYNNFIGEIEIMPISPLLSTQQRNIRKNAYNLLKRLGEQKSLFGMNSAEVVSVTEQDYDCDFEQQHRQKRQMELEEEVNDLKRQLGECTDIIVQLQDNLRTCSKDATTTNDDNDDDDVASKRMNEDEEDEGNMEDDKAEQRHVEIAELTRQLQSITVQTTQDAQQIQILETQLQYALEESSHQSDKMQEYEETIDSLNKIIVQLQDNLRTCSKDATNDDYDDVAPKGINDEKGDEGNKEDDEAEQLHAEVAELTRQLQSITVQTTQDAQKIQLLETQLQYALEESSHQSDKMQEYEEAIDSLNKIIVQLQDNLRTCSKDATNDDYDDVASKRMNEDEDDEGNKEDDEAEQLHAEVAELTRQLQSITVQTTQDAQQIQILETQLQYALEESSHQSDKMQEYEETIDSLNKAMVQSSLYNEELVKELMILRKESDNLKMRLMDVDKKREEEKEADNTAMPSLEGEANASPFIAADVMDDGDDDATSVWGEVPSVFHQYRQQPLSTLQDHLVSCIKLPLQLVSVLFSVWVTIILLRIVLIFFFMVADTTIEWEWDPRKTIKVEDGDGFNIPGIY